MSHPKPSCEACRDCQQCARRPIDPHQPMLVAQPLVEIQLPDALLAALSLSAADSRTTSDTPPNRHA
ncbi:MAG: hypothetical protein AAGJ10_10085 [Bacteroidota bacterium]